VSNAPKTPEVLKRQSKADKTKTSFFKPHARTVRSLSKILMHAHLFAKKKDFDAHRIRDMRRTVASTASYVVTSESEERGHGRAAGKSE
jgi:predicted nuclease of restriction endonuclease-like RecB superfamily